MASCILSLVWITLLPWSRAGYARHLDFAGGFSGGDGRGRGIGRARRSMPGVETGIALSGVILGLMVAFAAKPPLKIA